MDSQDLLDISVTSMRKKGEHRRSGFNYNKNIAESWVKPERRNPWPIAVNHAKHVGKIYRKAERSIEMERSTFK